MTGIMYGDEFVFSNDLVKYIADLEDALRKAKEFQEVYTLRCKIETHESNLDKFKKRLNELERFK